MTHQLKQNKRRISTRPERVGAWSCCCSSKWAKGRQVEDPAEGEVREAGRAGGVELGCVGTGVGEGHAGQSQTSLAQSVAQPCACVWGTRLASRTVHHRHVGHGPTCQRPQCQRTVRQ
jgi:hypothetical protein